MLAKALFACFLIASVSAANGPILDQEHHTHEVLDNIHNTHHCAYPCIFDEELIKEWTPECLKLKGSDYGACLCRGNAYQYMLDQCIGWECDHTAGAGARKTAREMNAKSCKHYGVEAEEMYKLDKIK